MTDSFFICDFEADDQPTVDPLIEIKQEPNSLEIDEFDENINLIEQDQSIQECHILGRKQRYRPVKKQPVRNKNIQKYTKDTITKKEKRIRKCKVEKKKKIKCEIQPERSKRTFEEVVYDEETVPHMKDGIFEAFTHGENIILDCITYKNIQLTRPSRDKGYIVNENDLNKFKDSDKMEFKCEDCDYKSEKLKSFQLHFILHANIYHTVESINKALKTFYCYLCDKQYESESSLSKHLNKHWGKSNDDEFSDEDITEKDLNEVFPDDWQCKDSPSPDNDYFEMPIDDKIPSKEFTNDKHNTIESVDVIKDDYIEQETFKNHKINIKQEIDLKTEVQDLDLEEEKLDMKIEELELDKKLEIHLLDLNVEVQNTIMKVEVQDLDKFETKKIKCKKCHYETISDKPRSHKCKEVRQCEICNKVLISQRIYKYHKEQHSCKKCFFQSINTEDVKEHKKNSPDCWTKCRNCDFKTINDASYTRHLKSKACFKNKTNNKENTDDIYICDICRYKTKNKKTIIKHIDRHFWRRNHCNKCSFESTNAEDVKEHKKNSPDCWNKCSNCDFKTLNDVSYARHVRLKTCLKDKSVELKKSDTILSCDICPYQTEYNKRLIYHMKQHKTFKESNKDNLICRICKKPCYCKMTLQKHVKRHYCGRCPFVVTDLKDMFKHRKSSPNCQFKCKNCDYTNTNKDSVRKHAKKDCGKVDWTSGRIRRKTFLCDICDYKTDCKKHLETHKAKHVDPKPYQCSECGYKCVNSHILANHEKKHLDIKSYTCKLCDFQCSRLQAYLTHKKIHNVDEGWQSTSEARDPRLFYCDKCEYRSKYPQQLKYHKMNHDKTRLYLCPLCGKTFHSLGNYHLHKNKAHVAHSSKKIHKCSFCDYTNSAKAIVKIHERKHTGAKPYTCEFCSYSTSYQGNLNAHRKKHLTNFSPDVV